MWEDDMFILSYMYNEIMVRVYEILYRIVKRFRLWLGYNSYPLKYNTPKDKDVPIGSMGIDWFNGDIYRMTENGWIVTSKPTKPTGTLQFRNITE